jgi:hypothetical protein
MAMSRLRPICMIAIRRSRSARNYETRIRQALCLIRKKLDSNGKITEGDGHA